MNNAPLNSITVDKNGDIRVGNAVFRSTYHYVNRDTQHTLLRDILSVNGYMAPLNVCNDHRPHSKLVAQYSHLKGFHELSRLTDGRISIKSYDFHKTANKYSASIFGPGFLKRLRGIMYREWLLPFEGHLNDLGVIKYGYRGERRGFVGNSPEHTYMLRKSAQLVRQLIDDGLVHLAPFVMLFRRSPQDLKGLLGKGLWRQLCANSKSRNKLILFNILMGLEERDLHTQSTDTDDFIDSCQIAGLLDGVADGAHDLQVAGMVRELNKIPSSYLGYMSNIHVPGRPQDGGVNNTDACVFPLHHWVWPIAKSERKLCQGAGSNRPKGAPSDRVRFLADIFIDTYEMSVKLNKPFNYKWSLKRMQDSHDRYSKEMTAKTYSDTPYAHCLDIPDEFVFDVDGVRCVAEIVSSPFDVAMLGKSHFNCLASYANTLSTPDNLLFRVVVGDKESACLLNYANGMWRVSQHYHPQNVRVKDVFSACEKLLLKRVDEYSEILHGCSKEQLVGVDCLQSDSNKNGDNGWGVESLWKVDTTPF